MSSELTNDILESLNYLNDSKKAGNNVDSIVVELVSKESKLFAKKVLNGKATEDEMDAFEATIPGDWAYQGMDDVKKEAKEAIDVSAMMYAAHENSLNASNGVKHM